MAMLMKSFSDNYTITCDKKIVEICEEFQIDAFENNEPKLKINKTASYATTKKVMTKTYKSEYDMNLYLSILDSQTKYTIEERNRIFKEVFDTNRTDVKTAKLRKPFFKISMTRIDSIRIMMLMCIVLKRESSRSMNL
jgi:hypothetical protein